MYNKFLGILFGCIASISARAELVSYWGSPTASANETMAIAYKNNSHIRVDQTGASYLLITGEKTYSIEKEDDRLVATDLSELGASLGLVIRAQNPDAADGYEVVSMVDTGRTEVIAGYEGKVYEATTKSHDGTVRTDEFVLSDNNDVIAASNAMTEMSERMSAVMQMPAINKLIQNYTANGNKGILRFGDDLVLKKVENKEFAVDYFELPRNIEIRSLLDF